MWKLNAWHLLIIAHGQGVFSFFFYLIFIINFLFNLFQYERAIRESLATVPEISEVVVPEEDDDITAVIR